MVSYSSGLKTTCCEQVGRRNATQRGRPGAVSWLCPRMSDNVTVQNENLLCEMLTRNTANAADKLHYKKWTIFWFKVKLKPLSRLQKNSFTGREHRHSNNTDNDNKKFVNSACSILQRLEHTWRTQRVNSDRSQHISHFLYHFNQVLQTGNHFILYEKLWYLLNLKSEKYINWGWGRESIFCFRMNPARVFILH